MTTNLRNAGRADWSGHGFGLVETLDAEDRRHDPLPAAERGTSGASEAFPASVQVPEPAGADEAANQAGRDRTEQPDSVLSFDAPDAAERGDDQDPEPSNPEDRSTQAASAVILPEQSESGQPARFVVRRPDEPEPEPDQPENEVHSHTCDCVACSGLRDDPLAEDAEPVVVQVNEASAPSPLGDLADYLRLGYWSDRGTSAHRFNLGDSGSYAKSGVIHYDVDGFSGSVSGYSDSDGLTAARADLVRNVLDLYGDVLGISFVEVTPQDNQSITDLYFMDAYSGAFGGSSWGSGFINYSYVNVAASWSGGTSGYNDYTLQTVFHEVGHALGLGHQGNYNGSASYPGNATFENDSWQASMMSYFSQSQNSTINASSAYLQTPMSVDWMALQDMYGGQSSGGTTFGVQNAFLGDTTYGFNTTITAAESDIWANFSAYGNRTASTIIDAGGIDTLDVSGWSNNTLINLGVTSRTDTAPQASNIGGRVGNLTMAEGTVIENAVGGAGNEEFRGNDADNQFWGNGGDDLFIDSQGSDIYRGGAGNDTVDFAGLFSSFAFEVSGSFMSVAEFIGAPVFDLVENTVEWFAFDDVTYSFADIEGIAGVVLPSTTIDQASDNVGAQQGTLADGDATDDASPTLSGTISSALSGGQVVTVYRDGSSVGNASVSGTTWTFTDAGVPEGAHTWTAQVVDGLAQGSLSAGFDLTVDQTAPIITVDPLTTNDQTPELTGTIDDATASISIEVNGGIYGATNNGDGTWTLADNLVAPALPAGSWDVMAWATDAAGNRYDETAVNALVIDLTPPAAPTVDALPATNDNTPLLTGTAVLLSDETLSVTVAGQTYSNVSVSGSTWSVQVTTPIADGTYDVVAVVTDAAGNASQDGSTGELTINATPPVVTVDPLVTNDTTPGLSGTVDDTAATVRVQVDGVFHDATNNGDGTWTIADDVIAPLGEGTWDILAEATDGFGNVGSDASTGELVIDLTPPAAPTVDAIAPTADSTPVVTGTATLGAGERLDVTIDGLTYADVAVSGGTWSVQVTTALADGTYEVLTTVTDGAGNSASDTTSGELVIDSSIGFELFGTAAGQEDLVGGAGDDTIGGLEKNSAQSGAGTIDTLTGGHGSDVFILGTQTTRYYDDGNPNAGNNGRNDYALITDFGVGNDRIELHGTGYLFESYSLNGVTGTGIFHDAAGNGFDSKDELIGLLADIDPADVQASLAGGVTALSKSDGITGVTLFGGAGDDTFDAGPWNDVIYGGGGNDRAQIVGNDMADDFHGGAGNDTLDLGQAATGGGIGAEVDLGGGFYVWGAGSPLILTGVENVVGTDLADTLTGDAGDNTLEGGGGADTLNGGAGADTASYAGSGAGVTVSLGGALPASGGDAEGDLLSGIENLIGSDFSDLLFGDSGANVIFGGAGGDVLSGEAGADVLYGGAGFDVLSGADGGAGAADMLFGGSETDIAYYYNADSSQVVDLSDHTDLSKNSGEHTLDTWDSIEGIYGANAYSNTMTGDAGGNLFLGGNQADTLSGRGGSDILTARGGDDLIYGGDGDDYISGDAGDDDIYGDAGQDVFYILSTSGVDRLKDFSITDDSLLFYQTGASQWSDLTRSQVGNDVHVTLSGSGFTVIVENVLVADLDSVSGGFTFL